MPQPNAEPWYAKEGLKFTCTECGDCCTGAPGVVWVSPEEIAAFAKRLAMDVTDFETKYVRKVGNRKSLTEYENGDCVFLVDRKCTVYEDRPRQCRTWPFWDSNIKSPKAWAETCESCPGSGVGKVFTVEEILERAAVIRI
ncbi:MAG: YkgJ family cysteine cluster protein [Pirellulales bacterium]